MHKGTLNYSISINILYFLCRVSRAQNLYSLYSFNTKQIRVYRKKKRVILFNSMYAQIIYSIQPALIRMH